MSILRLVQQNDTQIRNQERIIELLTPDSPERRFDEAMTKGIAPMGFGSVGNGQLSPRGRYLDGIFDNIEGRIDDDYGDLPGSIQKFVKEGVGIAFEALAEERVHLIKDKVLISSNQHPPIAMSWSRYIND